MQRKGGAVYPLLHESLNANLALLDLPEGRGREHLVNDPRALGVGKVLVGVVAA